MRFCEKHPEIVKRFDRFWAGADTDRPVLFLSAPKDHPDESVAPPDPRRPEDRVLPENAVPLARHWLARTAYFAEGFPHAFVNFGPGILHACIGGEADLSSTDTVWFPPFLSDISEFMGLRFDPEGRWWRAVKRLTEAYLDELGDEAVVSFTDIGGEADVIASAVTTEQLLLDVVDRPELVKQAADHCHELWMELYQANAALFVGRQDVTTTWWPVLSRSRTYMTQCDFNALIGPKLFSELFAGPLGRTFAALDNPAYHLDGIGTEVHVPELLSQGGLQCIQWVPRWGTSALLHAAMLRSIQEAGVSVTFHARGPEDLEAACRELDHRRLMVTANAPSEAAARELIENTLRWCERKRTA